MIWTLETPKQAGWYWFRPTRNRPPIMSRRLTLVVWVGTFPPQGHQPHPLTVVFPQGTFSVDDLRGQWAGPLHPPKGNGKP